MVHRERGGLGGANSSPKTISPVGCNVVEDPLGLMRFRSRKFGCLATCRVEGRKFTGTSTRGFSRRSQRDRGAIHFAVAGIYVYALCTRAGRPASQTSRPLLISGLFASSTGTSVLALTRCRRYASLDHGRGRSRALFAH